MVCRIDIKEALEELLPKLQETHPSVAWELCAYGTGYYIRSGPPRGLWLCIARVPSLGMFDDAVIWSVYLYDGDPDLDSVKETFHTDEYEPIDLIRRKGLVEMLT